MNNGNEFYKKYEPINWKDDGVAILNKIGNNLVSRFDSIVFSVAEDIDDLSLKITIRQSGNLKMFWWSFNEDGLYAQLETSDGMSVKNITEVENLIQDSGIILESNGGYVDKYMKNLRTFKNWIDKSN